MKLATCEQMRFIDNETINRYGISSLQLMQNAAACLFDVICQKVKVIQNKKVLILCGKGNNAGDGFALANILADCTAKLSVLPVFGVDVLSADCEHFYNLCVLKEHVNITENIDFDCYDIIVDAIFGIGFAGELPCKVTTVLEKANSSPALRFAVDLPSGVNCDFGDVKSTAFAADYTVTFGHKKPCHLLYPSKNYCGCVIVSDIGFKTAAVNGAGLYIEEIDCELVANCMPQRDPLGHKGVFGTLSAIVGSTSYQGAAALSAQAAIKCGVGITHLLVPESIYTPVATKTRSAVIDVFEQNEKGMIKADQWQKMGDLIIMRKATALLLGCGLGISDDTEKIVENALDLPLPMVIDGDGLTALKPILNRLKSRKHQTLLTPHMGEFARICGLEIEDIKADRINIARRFAMSNNAVILLKDALTTIAVPTGQIFILSAPCSALAKGGSGDVLAGMLASFIAQGLDPLKSAVCAVFLHNKSAAKAAEKLSDFTAGPIDFLDYIGESIREVGK